MLGECCFRGWVRYKYNLQTIRLDGIDMGGIEMNAIAAVHARLGLPRQTIGWKKMLPPTEATIQKLDSGTGLFSGLWDTPARPFVGQVSTARRCGKIRFEGRAVLFSCRGPYNE